MLSSRYLLFLSVTLALSLAILTSLYADEPSIPNCMGCHETKEKILPADHQNYQMDTTNLCIGCHKESGTALPLGKRVHTVHLEKSPHLMENCLSCHQPDDQGKIRFYGYSAMETTEERMGELPSFFISWANSSFLDNSHAQRGTYCMDCHSDYVDEYSADDTQEGCIKCHGDYEEMIKKTADTKFSYNPHDSHYVDLKCSACHHGHKEFEDYCGKCHGFDYKMPEK